MDNEEDESPASSQSSSSSRRSSVTPSKKLRGQDLFDSRVFNSTDSTTTFFRFIASLRDKIHSEVKETSSTHKLIRVLRDGGRLMRCYTQNIDGLEAREGLVMDLKRGKGTKRRFMKKTWAEPRVTQSQGTDQDGGCEVVQLHGDLETLRCSVCATQWTWTENETEVFMDGFAPRCQKCSRKSAEREKTGKRGLAVGSLRPNIVLYGEEHPQNSLLSPFVPFDASSQPDVLIIMGTSLKVFGLQKIIREFAKAVHATKKGKVIFVNRTKPAESVWDSYIDYFVPMDCDDWVADLRVRRSDLWLRQGELGLNVTKPTSQKKRKSQDISSGTDDQPATKKQKPVVEIPVKGPAQQKPPQSPSPRTRLAPLTPRPGEGLRQKMLSPLMQAKRPEVSPAKSMGLQTPTSANTVKSPRSPMFSPISPATLGPSGLRKAASARDDLVLEIEESDHEKENRTQLPSEPVADERDIVVVTPSKSLAAKIELPLVLETKDYARPPATRSTHGYTKDQIMKGVGHAVLGRVRPICGMRQ